MAAVVIDKDELYFAYRKAKADLFQNSHRALDLLCYEKNLEENLEKLKEELEKKDSQYFEEAEFVGSYSLLPKKVTRLESESDNDASVANFSKNDGIHYSTEWKYWDALSDKDDIEIEAQFRIMEHCSIQMHVLSALWVMRIGAKLEEKMAVQPYANRIRRSREGTVNKHAIGSFKQYSSGYKAWTNDGVKALENLNEEKKEAICLSLDVRDYFHTIPSGILKKAPIADLIGELELSDADEAINTALHIALRQWHHRFSRKSASGLPVGLSCSSVIGNLVLNNFDRKILEEVKPRFYGRYVDDITIVLESSGALKTKDDIWKWLAKRIDGLAYGGQNDVEYIEKDFRVTLNDEKTHVLISEGCSGRHLVDKFRRQIEENASEWRLLSQVPEDHEDVATDILVALDLHGEPASRPGKMGRLSARRNGIALKLRGFYDLAQNCDVASWKKHRKELYDVFIDQIFLPEEFFQYYKYILRIIQLAANCGDVEDLNRLLEKCGTVFGLIQKAQKLSVSGFKSGCSAAPEKDDNSSLVGTFIDDFTGYVYELLLAAPATLLSEKEKKTIIESVREIAEQYCLTSSQIQIDGCDICQLPEGRRAQLYVTTAMFETCLKEINARLALADLAAIPAYRMLSPKYLTAGLEKNWGITPELFNFVKKLSGGFDIPKKLFFCLSQIEQNGTSNCSGEILDKFVKYLFCNSGLSNGSREIPTTLPFLIFPTRPMPTANIISWSGFLDPGSSCAEHADDNGCDAWIFNLEEIETIIIGMRGFSLKKSLGVAKIESFGIFGERVVVPVDRPSVKAQPMKVAVSSISGGKQYIATARNGKPDRSRKRYLRFAKFFDLVTNSIDPGARPDYLLLPEISLPAPWFNEFAQHLAQQFNMALISGIEYFQGSSPSEIRNQIWASLPTHILGFPIPAIVKQDKQFPAHGERELLLNHLNQSLVPKKRWKNPPIVQHGDFLFAMLICSELTNIEYRASLRGRIDALFIAEFNRDLNTFNSLVESAALDIHAFIVQSNVRDYGDSRIRAPYKEDYKRDLVRVRGGENDHFVVAKLDIDQLRSFQSYIYRTAPFKPLPDSFKLDESLRHNLP